VNILRTQKCNVISEFRSHTASVLSPNQARVELQLMYLNITLNVYIFILIRCNNMQVFIYC